jgi:hypothetical protein
MAYLEEFLDGLHAPDRDERIYSVNAIAHLGPSAASAIPELVALLDDPDEDIARLSLRALSFLGPDVLSLKPRIVGLLRDPRSGVRQMAAFALGAMGTSATDAIPFLISTLDDQDFGVQMHVMTALGRVTDNIERTVQLLRQALEHEDEQFRDDAEQALRREYADARSTDKIPTRADPPGRPLKRRTVRKPDEEESRQIADFVERGQALLPADLALQGPEDVVSAITALIDDVRARTCRLTGDEAIYIATLLGEQIRKVTGWSWVFFSADGLDRSLMGLTTSDCSRVCIPAETVYNNLADEARANTIPLLFRAIAQDRLPPADAGSLELVR